jgi:hypothetical protein
VVNAAREPFYAIVLVIDWAADSYGGDQDKWNNAQEHIWAEAQKKRGKMEYSESRIQNKGI